MWTILQRASVDPAPKRSALTWRQFLHVQAKGVLAEVLITPVRAARERRRGPVGGHGAP